MHRVVITGIGIVSPIGSTIEAFWSGLVEGKSGIGPITLIATDRLLSTRIAAEVRGFDPAQHFDAKRIGLMDRFAQFAIVAARAAMKDAQLELTEEMALEAATIVGNGAGGINTLDDAYLKLYGQNATRAHPLSVPRAMANAACSHISMDLGLKGPTFTTVSACASGTHAIGQAFQMVRSGQAPVALAGGTEACLTLGTFKGWEALRVLSADTCRPFSRNRTGLVLGEGAAMFVLETREAAMARGAPIYAELLGFGMSADAHDITAIDPGGAARAMRGALKDGKLNPEDVDYVNAHGTGTMLNDKGETAALRMAFGDAADQLQVSSSKAVLGHSLGAAGALELAVTALALRHQTIPPTANFDEPDPDCDLDYVPNTARNAPIEKAMTSSFAFGGLNAVLALGRA
jgi:nodulation protein E